MAISSTSLVYKYGKPVVAKYTESGTHNAGDVVVIGATPFVAHVDVPQFTGGTLVDALACGGGIYTGLSDGTPKVGQDVYWNTTSSKFTGTAAGNAHFGTCVAGPTGDLAGASPTADGDAVDVLHLPDGIAGGVDIQPRTEATQSTAATLTAAQLLGGMINSAPAGAITLTLPTAANLVAGVKGAQVGDSFDVTLENTSGGANTITLAAGGATLRGGTAVAQNKSALLRVLITNVGSGTEAYTVHSIVGA
jgi:hypothetical protein